MTFLGKQRYVFSSCFHLLKDADLPEGVEPDVQPLQGPTGEVYRYTLASDKRSVRELKTLQDWVVERNLRAVSGVADVVSFGGEVKTFEVSVNPNQLATYGISSLELYEAIANSNVNVGGDVIEKNAQAYVVRGIGLINDAEEIGNVVIKNEIRYWCAMWRKSTKHANLVWDKWDVPETTMWWKALW